MMTCPLKDNNYVGNCEFCNERMDCMMREIMQKLESLETTVAQMKSK
jgi:hypothetical protein